MAKAATRDGNWVRDLLKRKEVMCYLDIDIDGASVMFVIPASCAVHVLRLRTHKLTSTHMRFYTVITYLHHEIQNIQCV